MIRVDALIRTNDDFTFLDRVLSGTDQGQMSGLFATGSTVISSIQYSTGERS